MSTRLQSPAIGGRIAVKSFSLASFLAAFVSCVLFPAASQGANIRVELGGMNVSYDSATGDIVDVGNPDLLNSATFYDGDTQLLVDTTGVTMELLIPNVEPIVAGMTDTYLSDPGGSVVVNFGPGESISLTLDEVTVVYQHIDLVPGPGSVQFVGVASVASVNGQTLPLGLVIGDPITFSFSSQVTSLTVDGNNFVESFVASGTGEIAGNNIIPEPTSLGLLALSGLLGSMMAYRYRLG